MFADQRPRPERCPPMRRIDTHQHTIPPFYREALSRAGIDAAGGRDLPDWTPELALRSMAGLSVSTAIMSVSTPGTSFLEAATDASAMAVRINDFSATMCLEQPERFGFFATLPTPHADHAADEAARALDELHADGVVLLSNSGGRYLGEPGLERLWDVLNTRKAVVFIHPADLAGPAVDGVPPFAADFLLDTTRAAYLLVRNGIVRKYPSIRFVLSHGGGFVPYAAHRLAVAITADTSRSVLDSLDDFRTFYFDTALSSSPAALPTLLAFAAPGHITFGSDWPFAPATGGQYFAACLDDYAELTETQRVQINWSTAAGLLGRDGQSLPQVPAIGFRGKLRRKALATATALTQP